MDPHKELDVFAVSSTREVSLHDHEQARDMPDDTAYRDRERFAWQKLLSRLPRIRATPHRWVSVVVTLLIMALAAGGCVLFYQNTKDSAFQSGELGSEGMVCRFVIHVTSINVQNRSAPLLLSVSTLSATGVLLAQHVALNVSLSKDQTFYFPAVAHFEKEESKFTRLQFSSSIESRDTPLAYPFDQYTAHLRIIVTDSETGRPAEFMMVLLCQVIGLRLELRQTSDDHDYTIIIARAWTTRIFVVLIMIALWTASLMILYITLSLILNGRAIPLTFYPMYATCLFAIPQIRDSMPNAPTFGTYADLSCFLVDEVVIAACFCAILITFYSRGLPKRGAPGTG